MDFKRYLNETARILDKEISKILDEWEKEVGKISPKLIPLAQAFIKACEGGKRIRGVLVGLGYEIACRPSGGPKTPRNDVISIGAAYEIFHTAILVHDDIIDDSPIRRGKPTLFKALGGDHRGISLAITLADLGFFLAIKIISESNFPNKEKNEALMLFSKTVVNTAVGQILDIQKEDPILTARFKTAQYTICGPLALGAILAGADLPAGRQDKKLLGLLGSFGENLGIAYQIRDDILDRAALDTSLQEGVKYVRRAKSVIPKITKDKKMAKMLSEMADFLVERSK